MYIQLRSLLLLFVDVEKVKWNYIWHSVRWRRVGKKMHHNNWNDFESNSQKEQMKWGCLCVSVSESGETFHSILCITCSLRLIHTPPGLNFVHLNMKFVIPFRIWPWQRKRMRERKKNMLKPEMWYNFSRHFFFRCCFVHCLYYDFSTQLNF